MSTERSPEVIAARYQLLCRATLADAENTAQAEVLDKLQQILKHDLVSLSRRGCPDNFADIYFSLEQELERFREFCAFPALAQKVVIGFGGAFSSGKSSLINALLGQKLLATEVDPTTTLPTYLLQGEQDGVLALNLFRHLVPLSHEEFLSLTHDELALYGSNVSRLLQAAFRTVSNFPWNNLALVDTPGYSKPDSETWSDRTDEHVARAQLNASQAIVWVVSADSGTISEDDLRFMASLRPEIPRLVAVSRADKKTPQDIAAIVAGISNTLAERNLPVLAVIPVSAHKKRDYPLQAVLDQLQAWNSQPRELRFAHNFKRQFSHYAHYLEERQRSIALHLNRLNRIVSMADGDDVREDAEELRGDTQAAHQRLKIIQEELHALRQRFFAQLKQIGDKVGIPLPEPADIDLIDIQGFDLLGLLREAREKRGGKEMDYRKHWRALSIDGIPANLSKILKGKSEKYSTALQLVFGDADKINPSRFLRPQRHCRTALKILCDNSNKISQNRFLRGKPDFSCLKSFLS